jgi:hypothetical protein
MMRRRLFVAAALATVLAAREASGDIYHLKSPSQLKTEKGSELKLPPGYFLDEKTWQERDLEMRRLQEQETRLGAENKSLRNSLRESGSTRFYIVTFAVGVFTGFVGYQMMK